MSYLRYLCLFVYSGVQHILCCVFVLSCVPYDASLTELSIFNCPFGILKRLFMDIYSYLDNQHY